MRGYNKGAVIPQRRLSDVQPMRFSLIVKLIQEKEEPKYIVLPDQVKRVQDSTRGWFGKIVAVGDSIKRMRRMVGIIKPGTTCLFDESVSIDDPNRCFEWGEDRFVMFDIETVLGIRRKDGSMEMLGDRVMFRKPKRDDFKITKSKLWIPQNAKAQELGGVVTAVGPGMYNPDRDKYLKMEFKKGDFILFGKYSATDVKMDGIDYGVIRQDKVLAIVQGETERIKFQ